MDIKNTIRADSGLNSGQPNQTTKPGNKTENLPLAKEPVVSTMAKDLEFLKKKGVDAFRAWVKQGVRAGQGALKPAPLAPIPTPTPVPLSRPAPAPTSIPKPILRPMPRPAPQPINLKPASSPAPLKKPEPPAGLPIVESTQEALPGPKLMPVPKPVPKEIPAQGPSRSAPLLQPEIKKEIKPELDVKKTPEPKKEKKPELEPIKETKPKALGEPVLKPRLPKLIIIGLVIVLAVAVVGGFIYWRNYLKPITPIATHYECQDEQCVNVEGKGADTCQNDMDCQITPPAPMLLLPVDEDKVIELAIGEEYSLIEKLKAVDMEQAVNGALWRVLIKLTGLAQLEYLNLEDLISDLGLKISQDVFDNFGLSGNYTLFFYKQTAAKRLGLAAEIVENSPNLPGALRAWEQTMVDDLRPLFLETSNNQSPNVRFQDNIYQGVNIRYLNLAGPDLSIDYAVVGSNLIITTSRESMYAAIDAVLK